MPHLPPITNYRLTDHARFEMGRRQISETEVADVLKAPEQTETVRVGREVYQSRLQRGAPLRSYLLRVFVDSAGDVPEVVTAYLTSKVEKYWRTET